MKIIPLFPALDLSIPFNSLTRPIFRSLYKTIINCTRCDIIHVLNAKRIQITKWSILYLTEFVLFLPIEQWMSSQERHKDKNTFDDYFRFYESSWRSKIRLSNSNVLVHTMAFFKSSSDACMSMVVCPILWWKGRCILC